MHVDIPPKTEIGLIPFSEIEASFTFKTLFTNLLCIARFPYSHFYVLHQEPFPLGCAGAALRPFSPALLVAKIKALLRRVRQNRFEDSDEQQNLEKSILHFPDLTIDMAKCVVKRGSENIPLPAKEYQLLCVLAKNAGRVYSVEQLFQLVWGEDSLGDNRTVMVHISNLRKKNEPNYVKPKYVDRKGIGYKLSDAL